MPRTTLDVLRPVATLAVLTLGLIAAPPLEAFCGFYVSESTEGLHNDATAVTLMRKGQATVMAMENTYVGPPEDFAMVVPVPEVLEKSQVKTLNDSVFERVKKQTNPRLVEYWEQDPCPEPTDLQLSEDASGPDQKFYNFSDADNPGVSRLDVKVHTKFSVGEYDIVVLSSEESNALETWLTQNNYTIPKGSATYFRPYIQQGSYFFVAKVNTDKLKFSGKEAQLSPLRFHYESKDFKLPIRLGLINSRGTQDLLAFTIAKGQRYEVANRKNVLAPTNLVVDNAVRKHFGAFYNELFDRARSQHEDAVVTEYSWRAGKCDPCPVGPMSRAGFQTLGGDVIHEIGTSSDPTYAQESIEMSPDHVAAEYLMAYLDAKRRDFRHCARKLAREKWINRGNLRIRFTVGPSGRVRSLSVDEDDFGGAGTCMARQLFGTQFAEYLPDDYRGPLKINATYLFEDLLPGQTRRGPFGWTITRMHYRYDKSQGGRDLFFQKAEAIEGGRGVPWGMPGDDLRLPQSSTSGRNQYQARYMILHEWEGELDCDAPERGRWGRRGGGSNGVHTSSTQPTSGKLSSSIDELVIDGDVPSK